MSSPVVDSAAAQRVANLRAWMADLASRCRCEELMEDDDPCGASCPWCEKQKAAAGPPSADLSQVPRRYRDDPEAYFARLRAERAAVPPAPVPAPAPSRFAADAAVVAEKLRIQEAAVGKDAKVAAMREVFYSLFAFPAMVASAPRLRAVTEAKMAELETQEAAAPLVPLFGEVRAFLEGLKTRADYCS
jgi:hypothetical protein